MEYADRLEHAVNISSYFKLHVLRLRSLTPVTYLCKLLGIHSLVAFLQLELFEYIHLLSFCALHGAQISGAFDDQVI
ncbi:hypothetical protein ACNKHM_02945 [Shigella sonnei]